MQTVPFFHTPLDRRVYCKNRKFIVGGVRHEDNNRAKDPGEGASLPRKAQPEGKQVHTGEAS
jgi:hypothetical protein